jgi:ABC-type spermidine/putrescine transport system permease subunit II
MSGPPVRRPTIGSRLSSAVLPVFTGLAVIYLFVPIVVMIAFSFNDPPGRQNITWHGFTIENYLTLWGRSDVTGPMINSIIVAAVATIGATILGTLIGLALTRYEFRGRGPLNLLIYVPMATPEVILGASLLSLWVTMGVARGLTTIIIAHVMFNISYVVVTVRARIAGFNRSLEEAAMDLGAPPFRTFRLVTLPLIMPALAGGWLLAFTLSLDDLVIASFTTGPGATTLPMRIYSSVRLGVTPEINAVCTVLIGFVTVGVIAASLLQKRGLARAAEVPGGDR